MRRWTGGLSCSKYNTGHLLAKKKNIELDKKKKKNLLWSRVLKLLSFKNKSPKVQQTLLHQGRGLYTSYIYNEFENSECFPVMLMRDRFTGVNSIDFKKKKKIYCGPVF